LASHGKVATKIRRGGSQKGAAMSGNETNSLFDNQPRRKPDIPKPLRRNFEKAFERPLAHRADPLSSYKAGDRALQSGKVRGQMKLCLLGVRRWPSRTSAELAVLLGCSCYDTARRLPSLEHRGLVRKGPSRMCTVCKSLCVTWRAIHG
jgi:hypothetical protein